jgi:hypothetical protein
MDRPIDLTGRKFGKWVVLPRDGFEAKDRDCKWLVQCECGRLRHVAEQELLNGQSSSCGCASPRKNSYNGRTPVRNENGKSLARSEALRTRLHHVMNQLRPEEPEPWSEPEAGRVSGLIDEDTQSDRRMIV